MSTRTLENDWFERGLPDNVSVSDESTLYSSFAFLHCHSELPTGVKIGGNSGVYIGSFFDLGPQGSVEIGRFCSIVGAIIASNGSVRIGDFVLIAHEVTIAASPFATPDFRDFPTSLDIVIGDNVWIGTRAVLLGPLTIGPNSIIGAAAVVNFNVPPNSVVVGNPAHVVKKLVPPLT
jgi:acetyltransferase-like isoleucine patch superfamily enzyme